MEEWLDKGMLFKEERGLQAKEWDHIETRKGWERSPPQRFQEEPSPMDTRMLALRDSHQTPSKHNWTE